MGDRVEAAEAGVRAIAERGMLIGDERVARSSEPAVPHRNPATGQVCAEVVVAGPAEVDAAVAAARAALPGWRALPADERARALFRLADLLEAHGEESGTISAIDNGSPVGGLPPGPYTATWVRYYAGWVDKIEGSVIPVYPNHGLDCTRPQPYGVVAAFVPWNGPMMGMGQKVAPALAAGNTVVAKPPELAPFGAIRFAELALEAGLPPGALNVVPGGPVAGAALAGHPGVDKISFTGGAANARKVMAAAAEHLTPLALELGGKSANIIFPDADLDVAVPTATMLGVILLSGQGCALPTRLYVHDDVYDEVAARVVAQVEATAIGDPLDPGTQMGPVITEAACERIVATVARAVDAGAGELLTGGHRLGGDLADGYFVAGTVLGEVDQASEVARQEVFGPVLSILRFSDEDEVVAKANDSDYGLAAYVQTADAGRAQRVAEQLDAGYVNVNGFAAMSPNAPFGGTKQSGFGREGGRAGIEEFLQTKNIFIGR